MPRPLEVIGVCNPISDLLLLCENHTIIHPFPVIQLVTVGNLGKETSRHVHLLGKWTPDLEHFASPSVLYLCNPSICVSSAPLSTFDRPDLYLQPIETSSFVQYLCLLHLYPPKTPYFMSSQNPRGNFLRMTTGEERLTAFWSKLMILSFGRWAFFSLIMVPNPMITIGGNHN